MFSAPIEGVTTHGVILSSCLHIPITDYYAELHKGHLVVIYKCVILTMTNK